MQCYFRCTTEELKSCYFGIIYWKSWKGKEEEVGNKKTRPYNWVSWHRVWTWEFTHNPYRWESQRNPCIHKANLRVHEAKLINNARLKKHSTAILRNKVLKNTVQTQICAGAGSTGQEPRGNKVKAGAKAEEGVRDLCALSDMSAQKWPRNQANKPSRARPKGLGIWCRSSCLEGVKLVEFNSTP